MLMSVGYLHHYLYVGKDVLCFHFQNESNDIFLIKYILYTIQTFPELAQHCISNP